MRLWTGLLSRCRPVHDNTPNAAGGEISLLAEGATYRRLWGAGSPVVIGPGGVRGSATVIWMRNRASARYQIQMDELNQTDLGDDEDLDGWVRRNLSEAFVRRDRRRLIGVPEASRDAFFGQLQAWAGVGGRQPTFTVEEVLDVRDDRLVLCLLSIGPPSGPRSEQLQVLVYDRAAECIDGMLSFDPDDLAGARAELDRVHVGIEGDGM